MKIINRTLIISIITIYSCSQRIFKIHLWCFICSNFWYQTETYIIQIFKLRVSCFGLTPFTPYGEQYCSQQGKSASNGLPLAFCTITYPTFSLGVMYVIVGCMQTYLVIIYGLNYFHNLYFRRYNESPFDPQQSILQLVLCQMDHYKFMIANPMEY